MKNLQSIIFSKVSIFFIIGLFGLAINLLSFSFYINIFNPVFSSFLAFSTAVGWAYFCHSKFLWTVHSIEVLKPSNFIKFYSGYSISMTVNLLVVYFFQDNVDRIIYFQFLGIVIGSIFNFFVSKFVSTQHLK